MNRQNSWSPWKTDDLRMRYRPRSRIGQAFLTVVPWLDLTVITILFLATRHLLVLQPGIGFDLPAAPFREGSRSGMTAVLLHVESPAGRENLVFFDDERFRVHLEEDLRAMQQAITRRIRARGQRELLLHIDSRVEHGVVMRLVNLVREAGVTRVNVSLKEE